MSDVDLSAEQYEQYREAGEILETVLAEAADRVEVGASHLEVAEFAEDRIEELGGAPAFPVNISIDEEASHATPARDDESVFGEEMVCLDIGVHVDGWIADAATTVDLSGNPEMVEAAEDALAAAIDAVEPGVHTGEIGAEIEAAIDSYDLNPVVNLTGHGLAQWDAHTGPNVPNRGLDTGVELQVGDVVAIEPFVTDGSGKVGEGSKTEIYSLVSEGRVRNRQARQVMETVAEAYRELPFAARWLDDARAEMSLRRLTMNDVLRSYPVLKEQDGALVSQAEHTIIVTEDGAEVTTG
ncbi:Methionine aminopeptidase [Halanaeroarchaeum sp. HSR-CO]|uniref:type II methionyl aminopeptidase n=1 Tax=Halanaeroarchaeum sp. HSR-CO TaxID=2866382 RepID=UPI00217CC974|nr:type II methionyl aminopeptidase [Halanaeroarchaeum sp. HSR-CO]UWG48807.1 Methionine aminopeptidase [Halanaeroarchaeum sp. HSR-CO]